MTRTWYLAIIAARNISKFSKYHSALRGSWYFEQFWNITRGIIANYNPPINFRVILLATLRHVV